MAANREPGDVGAGQHDLHAGNPPRGLRVDRKKIRLEEPIREVGTYMIEIEVSGGATARVKTIVAEQK